MKNTLLFVLALGMCSTASADSTAFQEISVGMNVVSSKHLEVSGKIVSKSSYIPLVRTESVTIQTSNGGSVVVKGPDLDYLWAADGCAFDGSGPCVGSETYLMIVNDYGTATSAYPARILGIGFDKDKNYVVGVATETTANVSKGQIFAGVPAVSIKKGECGTPALCQFGFTVGNRVEAMDPTREQGLNGRADAQIVGIFRNYSANRGFGNAYYLVRFSKAN